jgi:hypothetical protein
MVKDKKYRFQFTQVFILFYCGLNKWALFDFRNMLKNIFVANVCDDDCALIFFLPVLKSGFCDIKWLILATIFIQITFFKQITILKKQITIFKNIKNEVELDNILL